jgi:hypothetical protein
MATGLAALLSGQAVAPLARQVVAAMFENPVLG